MGIGCTQTEGSHFLASFCFLISHESFPTPARLLFLLCRSRIFCLNLDDNFVGAGAGTGGSVVGGGFVDAIVAVEVTVVVGSLIL